MKRRTNWKGPVLNGSVASVTIPIRKLDELWRKINKDEVEEGLSK